MTSPTDSESPAPALPPGTFRIDREGIWQHEGQEVTHRGILRNLYANLRVGPDGHYLHVGPARIPVTVEDAPFVVNRVEVLPREREPPAVLRLHLSDGSVEEVTPMEGSVWLGANGTPYCRVKRGRFTARLAVASWLQLAPFLEQEGGTDRLVLSLGTHRIPIERRP